MPRKWSWPKCITFLIINWGRERERERGAYIKTFHCWVDGDTFTRVPECWLGEETLVQMRSPHCHDRSQLLFWSEWNKLHMPYFHTSGSGAKDSNSWITICFRESQAEGWCSRHSSWSSALSIHLSLYLSLSHSLSLLNGCHLSYVSPSEREKHGQLWACGLRRFIYFSLNKKLSRLPVILLSCVPRVLNNWWTACREHYCPFFLNFNFFISQMNPRLLSFS